MFFFFFFFFFLIVVLKQVVVITVKYGVFLGLRFCWGLGSPDTAFRESR